MNIHGPFLWKLISFTYNLYTLFTNGALPNTIYSNEICVSHQGSVGVIGPFGAVALRHLTIVLQKWLNVL